MSIKHLCIQQASPLSADSWLVGAIVQKQMMSLSACAAASVAYARHMLHAFITYVLEYIPDLLATFWHMIVRLPAVSIDSANGTWSPLMMTPMNAGHTCKRQGSQSSC